MQKRAVETKTKILVAARQEFSQKGFHGAKVDEIAAVADVNKQRIYAYFQNKENLYAEVLKECYQTIITSETTFFELQDQDIPFLGKTLLKHYFSFHEQNPYFWRLIAWENLEGGHHVAALKGLRANAFDHLRKLYQKGQQRGIFQTDVSFEAFIFVLSAISFIENFLITTSLPEAAILA